VWLKEEQAQQFAHWKQINKKAEDKIVFNLYIGYNNL